MALVYRALLISLAIDLASPYKIWKSLSDIPDSVPERCREALSQEVDCPFVASPEKARGLNVLKGPVGASYCANPCRNSLDAFLDNIIVACGGGEYNLWRAMPETQSAKEFAESIIWARDLLCLEDDSGLCLEALYSQEREPCSDCALKWQALMADPRNGFEEMTRETYERALARCSIPKGSDLYTVYKYPARPASGPASGPGLIKNTKRARSDCKGTTYTVQEGDTCASISRHTMMATDRLIEVNYLTYSCSTLEVGMELCIQDTCRLALMEEGETCQSFVTHKFLTVNQLRAWNPTLTNACETWLTPNLDFVAGRYFCIGAPGQFDSSLSSKPWERKRPKLKNPWFTEWVKATLPPNPDRAPVTMTRDWDPDYTAPVQTIDSDADQAKLEEEYLKYCWLTEEDLGPHHEGELPDDCQRLADIYCIYDADESPPASPTSIPATCTPDHGSQELR
ncbi:hypothetical protein ACJ41O_013628 [Fusarium nematophilum]